MKPSAQTVERLKFAGGALIVIAAAFVMFPGFVTVALGLWRIALLIVVAGGVCLALAYGTRRLARIRSKQATVQAPISSADNQSG